jgi:LysM repeat protein
MGGHLSGAEKEALTKHLEPCTSCRTYASQMATLEADLRLIFHTRWDSPQQSFTSEIVSVQKKMRVHNVYRNIHRNILGIVGAAAIGILLFVVILFSVSILPRQITPGGAGITPKGIRQDTPQPNSTKPTPTTSTTSPVPVEINTRTQVITYTVQSGDTLFGIAEKFNLIRPDTILWGNPDTFDDLSNISLMPGMVLNILPVDGAYHRWKAGEDLNEVARRYGVSTQVIVNWPGNHLDPQTLGDYSNPNIEPGTMLVIPGGTLPFTIWSPPKTETYQP